MSNSTKLTIHEDWTVVILGFLIIGISLFIFLPEVPVFNWSNTSDLLKNIFDFANLKILFIQFLIANCAANLGKKLNQTALAKCNVL